MKIAILGSPYSILGFKAVGVQAFGVVNENEARKKLSEIIQSKLYAILFITEDWAEKLEKEIDEMSSKALPAILTVPSVQGSTKEGMRNLKKIVEKAVGSDILNLG